MVLFGLNRGVWDFGYCLVGGKIEGKKEVKLNTAAALEGEERFPSLFYFLGGGFFCFCFLGFLDVFV